MKPFHVLLLIPMSVLFSPEATFGVDRYVSPDGGHIPPFTNWASAATNIQAAIDVAVPGDQVVVTNGVYRTGGAMAPGGSLTNRVLLNKALVVRSVNGPETTVIEGQEIPGVTNGNLSVRCAWLTDGAVLSGFTLTNGFTRTFNSSEGSGAGAFCTSANATLSNCIVVGNSAYYRGGGVFQGTVMASVVKSNSAGTGGGTYNTWLANSAIFGNRAGSGGGIYCTSNGVAISGCAVWGNVANLGGGAYQGGMSKCTVEQNRALSGGGVYQGYLQNCTIRSNTASNGGGVYNSEVINSAILGNFATNAGGGAYATTATAGRMQHCTVVLNGGGGASGGSAVNSILYYNSGANYGGMALTNCCSDPIPRSLARSVINAEPMLMSDGIHLLNGSPCIGRGTNAWNTGVDYDGQNWNDPPSIGCDEWNPTPIIVTQPRVVPGRAPGEAQVVVEVAGDAPYCWWTKDGTVLEESAHYNGVHGLTLGVGQFDVSDAGAYQLTASNSFGVVTSSVAIIRVACVDAASSSPLSPYQSWENAAQTIQQAVDTAEIGTVLLVTNGIYASGGRLVAGDTTTNRVVLDRAVTVLSRSGPEQTIIEGAWDSVSTNGPASVRCLWVGEGAAIGGFTLRNGSTASNGGGVYAVSILQETMAGCVITNCSAARFGGGAWQGRLRHCVVAGNTARYGGGLATGWAEGSEFRENSAGTGGGVYQGWLNGSSVTLNSGSEGAGIFGGQVSSCLVATNMGDGLNGGLARFCQFVGNTRSGAGLSSVQSSFFRGNIYSGAVGCTNVNCTFVENGQGTIGGYSTNCIFWANQPLTVGGGWRINCLLQPDDIGDLHDAKPIWAFPNLLSDGWHLAPDSPCIGRGTNVLTYGTDLDGQPWSNPPSIGCDEWNPRPVIVSQPRVVPGTAVGGAQLILEVAGQAPYCWWTKDGVPIQENSRYAGVHTAKVSIFQFNVGDAGAYQVVVSNSFGMATSAVSQVTVACVDPVSPNPMAPFASWESASHSIQEAVDAAATGAVVLVTKGVYRSGGRVVSTDATTNRVVLDKPVTLMSLNGPELTVIEGAWDSATTNGPASVRCAWIGGGSVLGGFTLRNGSTASNGGGVRSEAPGLKETVIGCVITNCQAALSGGGAWQGWLRECVIVGNTAGTNGGGASMAIVDQSLLQGNTAWEGGGAYGGVARRCRIIGNTALTYGGGASGRSELLACAVGLNEAAYCGGVYNSTLLQCTIVSNTAHSGFVAGVDFSTVANSIVYFNVALPNPTSGLLRANAGSCGSYQNICYTPYWPVVSGITNDPQLVDLWHVAASSPCVGAGANLGAIGSTDIDGQAWKTPATIGCDEVVESQLAGPLSVQLDTWPEVAAGGVMPVTAYITGRASRLEWDFGDGTIVTNVGFMTSHIWTNAGDYSLSVRVINVDNPAGVSASAPVHVIALQTPILTEPAVSTNTSFTLQLTGQPGLTYELQCTTNLASPQNWQPVQSLTSTGGIMRLVDPDATTPVRFYRVQTR